MDRTKEIIPVFATPMSRQVMKNRLKTAEKGHNILKKKSDVLQIKFRKIGEEVISVKNAMGKIMKQAAYLLAETKFVTGDISTDVLNNVKKARLRIRTKTENIAGVELRIFECYEACGDHYGLTGLAKGGTRLNMLKKVYADAIEILVQLATLQTAFITLDEIILATNRRVNALEYRYIPTVENTIKYIETELDEKEREDFYRLKIVKNKKLQKIKERETERESDGEDLSKELLELQEQEIVKERDREDLLRELEELRERESDRESDKHDFSNGT